MLVPALVQGPSGPSPYLGVRHGGEAQREPVPLSPGTNDPPGLFPSSVFPEQRIRQLAPNPNTNFLWEGREQFGGLVGCTFPGGYRPF